MLDPKLTQTISDTFGMSPDDVNPASGRDTVPDWDSLAHLKLILSVENAFGVRFATSDIPKLTTAGDIQQALTRISTTQ